MYLAQSKYLICGSSTKEVNSFKFSTLQVSDFQLSINP